MREASLLIRALCSKEAERSSGVSGMGRKPGREVTSVVERKVGRCVLGGGGVDVLRVGEELRKMKKVVAHGQEVVVDGGFGARESEE
jgi:hypothetical protein